MQYPEVEQLAVALDATAAYLNEWNHRCEGQKLAAVLEAALSHLDEAPHHCDIEQLAAVLDARSPTSMG